MWISHKNIWLYTRGIFCVFHLNSLLVTLMLLLPFQRQSDKQEGCSPSITDNIVKRYGNMGHDPHLGKTSTSFFFK